MFETLPLHGISIAIQPEDMMRVHFPDGSFDAIIEGWESYVLRICGFVEGIVARDPRHTLIMSSQLFPQPDSPTLEVFMVPKCRYICSIV